MTEDIEDSIYFTQNPNLVECFRKAMPDKEFIATDKPRVREEHLMTRSCTTILVEEGSPYNIEDHIDYIIEEAIGELKAWSGSVVYLHSVRTIALVPVKSNTYAMIAMRVGEAAE